MRTSRRFAPLLALLLSASIAAPAAADAVIPSWAIPFVVSIMPFYMSSEGAKNLSEKTSGDVEKNKKWQVAAMRQEGDKTALTLRSQDGTTDVDTVVSSAAARAHGVQVNDTLDIETIGQAGFALKKAGATVGVMLRPDTGLVHSRVRT